MLAPELWPFVGIIISGNNKPLPGWEEVHCGGTIFTWKRKRDNLTLPEILDKPEAKDLSLKNALQLIKEGKL